MTELSSRRAAHAIKGVIVTPRVYVPQPSNLHLPRPT